jgi:hypothetical protein
MADGGAKCRFLSHRRRRRCGTIVSIHAMKKLEQRLTGGGGFVLKAMAVLFTVKWGKVAIRQAHDITAREVSTKGTMGSARTRFTACSREGSSEASYHRKLEVGGNGADEKKKACSGGK